MRKPMVAGNWKMNGSREGAKELLKGIIAGSSDLGEVDVVVCPPSILMADVAAQLADSRISWGAQDVATAESGAFTGEISAGMLNDFACRYAIVGHSERRALFHDTDEVVAEKFQAAQTTGLIPVLCVGELLEEREAGVTEQVVEKQLSAVVQRCGITALKEAVIAYEPVWAIGTGKTASPQQAQAVHVFIRTWLSTQDASVAESMQILYGGSVKANNAIELFAQKDIDGGLIGGASLQADEFLAICRAAK